MNGIIHDINSVLVVIGGLGIITFAISYRFFFNWSKNASGRGILYLAWAFIALFLEHIAGRFIDTNYMAREFVLLCVYSLVAFAAWNLVRVLWQAKGAPNTGVSLTGTIDVDNKELGMAEKSLIWYKNKRVWRTLFSGILTAAVVAPQLIAIINDAWPSDTLALVGAQALIVQGVITRIMANDTVNVWLSYIGLGSAPKDVLLSER